jgi:hypothetical protein
MKEGIWEKISGELKKQFPNAYLVEVFEETFIYGLEENGDYNNYTVEYSISPEGSLTIEWENAGLTDPGNI